MPLNHHGKAYKPGIMSEHCMQCDQQLAEKRHSTSQARDLGCKPSNDQMYDRYVTPACDMIVQQDGTESSMCLTLWGSDA